MASFRIKPAGVSYFGGSVLTTPSATVRTTLSVVRQVRFGDPFRRPAGKQPGTFPWCSNRTGSGCPWGAGAATGRR